MNLQREISLNELETIAAENNGFLPPDKVVEHARNPQSSLHDRFDWTDSSAAEKYRLMQARDLIRRVTITVVKESPTTKLVTFKPIRAFQSRQSQRGDGGGYEKTTDILASRNKRDEMITQVMNEMLAYRNRFADLSELGKIWAAIDEKAGNIEKPKKKRA